MVTVIQLIQPVREQVIHTIGQCSVCNNEILRKFLFLIDILTATRLGLWTSRSNSPRYSIPVSTSITSNEFI